LRKIRASKLEKALTPQMFAEKRTSHISRREFLQRMKDSPENYVPVELTLAYQGKKEKIIWKQQNISLQKKQWLKAVLM